MNRAVIQYFDRARWALHNAANDTLPPNAKSHLTAMAVHACQSLKESLTQWGAERSTPDEEFTTEVARLPHAQLIENIRNLDLHGWPVPICDPKVRMMEMVSKPGRPITLTSSHGVGVSLSMQGVSPKVGRSRKDMKHANVAYGPSVSWGYEEGKLIVHDFSTSKDYLLLEVLETFLQQCHALIKRFNDDRQE